MVLEMDGASTEKWDADPFCNVAKSRSSRVDMYSPFAARAKCRALDT